MVLEKMRGIKFRNQHILIIHVCMRFFLIIFNLSQKFKLLKNFKRIKITKITDFLNSISTLIWGSLYLPGPGLGI